ncbi:hypothetical protein FO519_009678, partial [Halicephalobus sp. NKZ332]
MKKAEEVDSFSTGISNSSISPKTFKKIEDAGSCPIQLIESSRPSMNSDTTEVDSCPTEILDNLTPPMTPEIKNVDSCSIEIPDRFLPSRNLSTTSSSIPSTVPSRTSSTAPLRPPSKTRSTTSSTEEKKGVHPLHYRVTEIPPWNQSILLAFQQTMICISGILAVPYLVSEIACAGSATIALRIKLISSTFVVTGFTTLLQTVIGLRLPILQGPSLAFLPPLYSYANLPELKCNFTSIDEVPEEYYYERIQTIQGSLACSSILLILIGATGAIGVVSKLVGPITIFPLLILLCLGNVNVIVDKASVHWISL